MPSADVVSDSVVPSAALVDSPGTTIADMPTAFESTSDVVSWWGSDASPL
jgi:hypothetical protein